MLIDDVSRALQLDGRKPYSNNHISVKRSFLWMLATLSEPATSSLRQKLGLWLPWPLPVYPLQPLQSVSSSLGTAGTTEWHYLMPGLIWHSKMHLSAWDLFPPCVLGTLSFTCMFPLKYQFFLMALPQTFTLLEYVAVLAPLLLW